jgi:cell wall-associated NlpC family hydrolase
MRKYILYILIVVATIGILSPVIKATAATCTATTDTTDTNACGICTVTNGRNQSTVNDIVADCRASVPPGSWVQIIPPTPTATCTITTGGNTEVYTNQTQAACNTAGGVWNSATSPANSQTSQPYVFLSQLPDPNNNGAPLVNIDVSSAGALGNYLNIILKLAIGIAAVLAMVMIVMGGIQYMTSDFISSKEEGKKRILNAIFGLLIALGAWLILYTINPDLLNTNTLIPSPTTLQYTNVGDESSAPFTAINQTSLQSLGITCNGSTGNAALVASAKSFEGKSTYSQTARNTVSGSTVNIDCSSFVDQVYNCAGLNPPGNNTSQIFSGAETVTNISTDGTTVNGRTLLVGDLIGWAPTFDSQGNKTAQGHVVMYIGNGQVIDATPSGVNERSLSSSYKGRITSIKRIAG